MKLLTTTTYDGVSGIREHIMKLKIKMTSNIKQLCVCTKC